MPSHSFDHVLVEQTAARWSLPAVEGTPLPSLTGRLQGDLAGLTGPQYEDPLNPGHGRQMCSRGQVTVGGGIREMDLND